MHFALTHSLIVTKISDNIACANDAAPSSPSNGARRVLLAPAMGHFAKTTIAPPTVVVFMHEDCSRCSSGGGEYIFFGGKMWVLLV